LIQWAQVRFGIGISTYGLNNKPEIFNIDAFITGKLGYNTINLGENYFQGINDFNKYLSGLEPGLRIDLNIYYKNIYYFRPYMDFTSFKSDFIKKLSIGVKNDYIFYIDMTSKNSTPIHLKIYLDVNYNKYNFKNDKLDFYKIDLGLLMFSTIYKY